ncbi:CvpA family protein [Paracoccaceae bacterium]|nr:CvpA family protein [Paracoccaceae bacterium]
MDTFNIVDGGILAIILLSAVLAYSRGLLRELMAIAGWVAAAVLGFIFAPQLLPLVKEIPAIGPILADSCELSIIVSFVTIFAVFLVVLSLFTPLLSSAIDKTAIGRLDRGLGLLFGLLRGVALIAITFFAYRTVFNTESYAIIEASLSAQLFSDLATAITERNPERALGWITLQYEQLVLVCE